MTSVTESKIDIVNDTWTLNKLHKILDSIKKPKFQREKKWVVRSSSNNKKANFEEFMKYLIIHKHSVTAISLGTYYENNKKYYIAIDGNNRINAVITFLEEPYIIFPYFYDDFFKFVHQIDKDKLTPEMKNRIIENIKKLKYEKISSFRRLDECLESDIEINDRHINREIEDELIKVQDKFKYSENRLYSDNIKLVINVFSGGDINEYSNLYHDLNKYQGTFSQNELLAAILFTTNVKINDERLKNDIVDEIKEYYDNKSQNEVLSKYILEKNYNMEISAFDFMVGFQNYCNVKYNVVEKFYNLGNNNNMFFKIFGILYGSLEKYKFTTENINSFIDNILFSCETLLKVYNTIFPKNINEKLFNKASVRNFDKLMSSNTLIVLFTSVIVNKDMECKKLLNRIRVTITFHLLCNKYYTKNTPVNEFKSLQSYDKIQYEAGGSFIDNMCKSIIDGKENIFDNVTESIMDSLLDMNIKSNINEETFIEKNTSKKRRKLNLVDKILMTNYWNRKVSNVYLNEKYSNEHITPFSSEWEGELDIDRTGNLFPTLEKINCTRGNKDLSIYNQPEHSEFRNFIDDILPKDYDDIVYHGDNKKTNSKPKIHVKEKFDEYCKKNEDLYKKLLIDSLYN